VPEAVPGAGINCCPVRIIRESGEPRSQQQETSRVAGWQVVHGGQDITDRKIVEQGGDASPEGGEADRLLEGMIKAIDADGSRLGQKFRP